jgi:hypothetical protein
VYKLVVKFYKNKKLCQSQLVEQGDTVAVKVPENKLVCKKKGNSCVKEKFCAN